VCPKAYLRWPNAKVAGKRQDYIGTATAVVTRESALSEAWPLNFNGRSERLNEVSVKNLVSFRLIPCVTERTPYFG
jgi:hypothetical protein